MKRCKHVDTFVTKWVCSIPEKLNVMEENWSNFRILYPKKQKTVANLFAKRVSEKFVDLCFPISVEYYACNMLKIIDSFVTVMT